VQAWIFCFELLRPSGRRLKETTKPIGASAQTNTECGYPKDSPKGMPSALRKSRFSLVLSFNPSAKELV